MHGWLAGADSRAAAAAEKLEDLKVTGSPGDAAPAEKRTPDKGSPQPPDDDDEEDDDARAKREAELKLIYEELAKEDPRCLIGKLPQALLLSMPSCPCFAVGMTPCPRRRDNMNVVFIGHVDAGKSTTGGQILYLTVRVHLQILHQ